jgi:hypothetical protein
MRTRQSWALLAAASASPVHGLSTTGPISSRHHPATMAASDATVATASAHSMERYRVSLFHQINTEYPGIEVLSEEPYILQVPNFVSAAEADALIAKIDASEAGESSELLSATGERTSVSVLAHDDEVSGLRARISNLVRVSESQMQPLKLTRYDRGAVFKRHTDCSVWLQDMGDTDGNPARFPNRFCTVLLYLNDCHSGGSTCWRWRDSVPGFYSRAASASNRLSAMLPHWLQLRDSAPTAEREALCIAPRRGTAVVHFPCTAPDAPRPLALDPNADHEAEEADDVKYVCQQVGPSPNPHSEPI